MKPSTTIREMVNNKCIIVPDYQRAYSWDTSSKDTTTKNQVNTFLSDLEDYLKSNVQTPYYFGHFLYEKIGNSEFAIIDGQQRLTTITIFVCALIDRIKRERNLTDDEEMLYEDIIKRKKIYHFSTVHYDNQLFRDYVIDRIKTGHIHGVETTSARRIIKAYDFFESKLINYDINHVEALLNATINASCTTHIVNAEAEAIQMFIFQNNRGKRPSRLEVLKAQFMYNIHIYAGDEADAMIDEVKNRFEHIYHHIAKIEEFVNEDEVLTNTLRVYFNSLWEGDSYERINTEIKKETRLEFIRQFALALDRSFDDLVQLKEYYKEDINIESALICGSYDIVLPFFIKAFNNGVPKEDISKLAKSIGDIVLRDSIIGTRANLRSRLNDVFKDFDSSVDSIVEHIELMKTTDDWWLGYWNNEALKSSIEENWWPNSHRVAKIILWKYENYLIAEEGKDGYEPISFNSIIKPHLEHIAPQTENEEPAAGYDIYDEDFREHYLLCIGNFLLLSAPHNESIGNRPFEIKRASYNQLRQQREVQDMTANDHIWDRNKIKVRKDKIIEFIMNNL